MLLLPPQLQTDLFLCAHVAVVVVGLKAVAAVAVASVLVPELFL